MSAHAILCPAQNLPCPRCLTPPRPCQVAEASRAEREGRRPGGGALQRSAESELLAGGSSDEEGSEVEQEYEGEEEEEEMDEEEVSQGATNRRVRDGKVAGIACLSLQGVLGC